MSTKHAFSFNENLVDVAVPVLKLCPIPFLTPFSFHPVQSSTITPFITSIPDGVTPPT